MLFSNIFENDVLLTKKFYILANWPTDVDDTVAILNHFLLSCVSSIIVHLFKMALFLNKFLCMKLSPIPQIFRYVIVSRLSKNYKNDEERVMIKSFLYL